MARSKSKVKINAGAVIVVEVDGGQHKFNCSSTNETTGKTPDQVLKAIQDCVKSSIEKASKKKSK